MLCVFIFLEVGGLGWFLQCGAPPPSPGDAARCQGGHNSGKSGEVSQEASSKVRERKRYIFSSVVFQKTCSENCGNLSWLVGFELMGSESTKSEKMDALHGLCSVRRAPYSGRLTLRVCPH